MKAKIIALILVLLVAILIIAAGPVVAQDIIKIGFGYGGYEDGR